MEAYFGPGPPYWYFAVMYRTLPAHCGGLPANDGFAIVLVNFFIFRPDWVSVLVLDAVKSGGLATQRGEGEGEGEGEGH